MATEYKFKKGDKVQVISECQSYGQIGTVMNLYNSWMYGHKYVEIRLNNGIKNRYNENSLVLANEQNNIDKGDNYMLMGNYKIAMVKFVQGTNTVKGYAFALFDNSIVVDDLVLCDTANGYSVAKVVELLPLNEYKGVTVTKEIICKVDFTDFENRKANRAKAKQLKTEMDKKIKDLQELTLYEMMAEKSPELKEMLEVYKGLLG